MKPTKNIITSVRLRIYFVYLQVAHARLDKDELTIGLQYEVFRELQ